MMGLKYSEPIPPERQSEYDDLLKKQRQIHQAALDVHLCGLNYFAEPVLKRPKADKIPTPEQIAALNAYKEAFDEEERLHRRLNDINDQHISQLKDDFDYINNSLRNICDNK